MEGIKKCNVYKLNALRAIKVLINKMGMYKSNALRAIKGVKKRNVCKSNALRAIEGIKNVMCIIQNHSVLSNG